MRPCLVAVFALCIGGLTAPVAAQQTFPYKAQLVAEDVYVRSGPGKNYYPTAKLQEGDLVEVYRHDPGGWHAVRPVEGSFEWISGRYLDVGQDGIAEVTADRVAARVGSQFSDVRDVIQVRLHKGELVEILDSTSFHTGPEAGIWHKIAPPSGSFRWIHASCVSPNPKNSGIRKTFGGSSPLIDPAVSRRAAPSLDMRPAALRTVPSAETFVEIPVEESRRGSVESQPANARARGINHWTPIVGGASSERVSPPSINTADLGTNGFKVPATDPNGSVTSRRIGPDEFQSEWDRVNLELSNMLVEEPTAWRFDALATRVRSLLSQAETAVERGRARLLLNRIEQSRNVKARYDAVADMETEIARQNRRQLAADNHRRPPATPPNESFDGSGRLRRVVSSTVGAPQYALVDEAGKVRCYVTPAPGMNMQYYLGRRIAVTGIRAFILDRNAQHVTAKHVTMLDDRPALR